MSFIVGTLWPASRDDASIYALADAGMDIARVNFSHAQYHQTATSVSAIHTYNATHENQVRILLDTKWPEIRTVANHPSVDLVAGGLYIFSHPSRTNDLFPLESIIVDYPFLEDFHIGMTIWLDSWLCACIVREWHVLWWIVESQHTHTIWARKHINVPEIHVRLPLLDEKDQRDVVWGIEQWIDIFALSFVRTATEVHEARAFIQSHWGAQLLRSKIEHREAIHHLEEIVQASDGVIVARWDLGIEIWFEKVPYYQEQIVALAKKYNKYVIVGTQCIESMQTSIIPTRAEVQDIYAWVKMGVDGFLLANEIAIGAHPILTVQTVKWIIDFATSV